MYGNYKKIISKSNTECPYCSKVEMAIPTRQSDDDTSSYNMHLIIRSDISTLDKTQVPLDVFFDTTLDIEQVCSIEPSHLER